MLSYQHSYHAGCFADVMKHIVLTRLLDYLTKKDNSLLYLDTHAGRGTYDLHDKHALKTNEAQQGIYPLWEKREQLSPLFSPYMDIISRLNTNHTLQYYPGSPEIAMQLLRQQDRFVFCELHPAEFEGLQQLPYQGRYVLYKKEDGLKTMISLVPPIERRGLIFIDPSYEVKIEYQTVVQAIKTAYKRCATATYCLWYPLINNQLPISFIESLQAIGAPKNLRLEFYMTQKPNRGMTGSGLWIINPPYTLAEESKEILSVLTKIIQPDTASYLVE